MLQNFKDPRKMAKSLKGIFSVYKEKGMTSMDVLRFLRLQIEDDLGLNTDMYGVRFGHGGILDHSACGVLAVALGSKCKKLRWFYHGDKKYSAVGCLGISTDTYDTSGKIIGEKPFDNVTKEMIGDAIKQFEGKILQKPPPYCALKLDRIRFSDLIGNGIDVSPEPRYVHCHSISCREFNPPYFSLDIHCGGGFYVRSLVHDLGLALGSCAHVAELERTQHGPFTVKDALRQYQWSYTEVMEAVTKANEMCEKYFITTKNQMTDNES
ncbi:probable tRNA pseudouridine synthase 1 [Limulus polyphemus]|uniref:tRNA pseudouridine(55) synthase n=1 Tax=Limulus polyphemus TaxID=6850 RepID=A0ABM1SPS2_LIMPO|nr:probable tRNA pseudouridine synthase 1 [Limulus polyphemus]